MPDAHVEILLDCYKFVLQNRMLSSGRLGKGSFQEVILCLFFGPSMALGSG